VPRFDAGWLPRAAALVVAVGAVVLLSGPRQQIDVTDIERAVARVEELVPDDTSASEQPDPIAVVGVTNLRGVVGGSFDHSLEQVTDVRHPETDDAQALDAAVEESDAEVLIVGDAPGVPPDYVPPPTDWCPVDQTTEVTVFVRRDDVPCTSGGG
jgi:hypothetical protein